MTEFRLVEFVCKHCGRKTVVHPDIPDERKDKVSICNGCWEKHEAPTANKRMAKIFQDLDKLLEACDKLVK